MAGHTIILNRETFDEALCDKGLAELNQSIIGFQRARPSPWSVPIGDVRQARREGKGVFPGIDPDPAAREIHVKGRGGHDITVRILQPSGGTARGTYLHLHSGGWVFGEAVENDKRLRALADETELATASIDYRLAPEHPFPAAPDDCEDVALALARGQIEGLPNEFLAIGGESAGAHLSVLTLLRLRDLHGLTPFRAANLVAGCYDLSLTPSVRNFGEERLILNTDDVKEFVLRFIPDAIPLMDPSVSPLYADLRDLPPALFSVGTRDPLVDDTLFMASRWLAAGNAATLSTWAGGCHVFQAFDCAAADTANREVARFLSDACQERAGARAAA